MGLTITDIEKDISAHPERHGLCPGCYKYGVYLCLPTMFIVCCLECEYRYDYMPQLDQWTKGYSIWQFIISYRMLERMTEW